jgi:hypothetical protein
MKTILKKGLGCLVVILLLAGVARLVFGPPGRKVYLLADLDNVTKLSVMVDDEEQQIQTGRGRTWIKVPYGKHKLLVKDGEKTLFDASRNIGGASKGTYFLYFGEAWLKSFEIQYGLNASIGKEKPLEFPLKRQHRIDGTKRAITIDSVEQYHSLCAHEVTSRESLYTRPTLIRVPRRPEKTICWPGENYPVSVEREGEYELSNSRLVFRFLDQGQMRGLKGVLK